MIDPTGDFAIAAVLALMEFVPGLDVLATVGLVALGAYELYLLYEDRSHISYLMDEAGNGISKALSQASTDEQDRSAQCNPPPPRCKPGDKVNRWFGGNSDLWGQSWTNEEINVQSRNGLGLETSNTAEWLATGTVQDVTGLTSRPASEWGRFNGGQNELIFQNPQQQILLDSAVQPEQALPWTLPSDPIPNPNNTSLEDDC